MLQRMRLISVITIIAALALLAACGAESPTNAGTGTDVPTSALATAVPTLASTATSTTGGGATGDMTSGTDLSLSVEGVQLAYSVTELSAPGGEEISVTFNNNSSALQHNWVLVRGGDDVAEQVDQAALQNAPDYTPPASSADVIAQIAMLDPGDSDTVTFTIDEPGSYTFLCTFPGHYQAGMKGTLTVE